MAWRFVTNIARDRLESQSVSSTAAVCRDGKKPSDFAECAEFFASRPQACRSMDSEFELPSSGDGGSHIRPSGFPEDIHPDTTFQLPSSDDGGSHIRSEAPPGVILS